MIALGAYGEGRGPPGYEVTPTMYIVGPDRKIRWNDSQARYRHLKMETTVANLEAALERELPAP